MHDINLNKCCGLSVRYVAFQIPVEVPTSVSKEQVIKCNSL